MFLDSQLLLSDAQAFTGSAASTNVIDTKAAGLNLPVGEPLALVITVDVAADITTGDETYAFAARTSAAAALTSPTDIASKTIAASALTAGSTHVLPLGAPMSLEYLGMYATLGGTSPSVTVTALIMPLKFAQQYQSYAKGYTIS